MARIKSLARPQLPKQRSTVERSTKAAPTPASLDEAPSSQSRLQPTQAPATQSEVKAYAESKKQGARLGGSFMAHKLNALLDKPKAPELADEAGFGLKKGEPPQTREVLHDANKVTSSTLNSTDFSDLNGDGQVTFEDADLNGDGSIGRADGRALLELRAPQAEAAVDALSPEQREQYAQVHQTVEGDLRAEIALQDMLLDGRLSDPSANQSGETLLGELHRLSTATSIPEDIDAKALVQDLVQELDNPNAIAQGSTPTCAPTTTAIYLAHDSPADYARIVADLATTGRSELANGHPLYRQQRAEDDPRSSSLQLIDGAFMEYANGVDHDYDGSALEHVDRETGEAEDSGGLTGQRFDKLFDAVVGRDTQYVKIDDDNRSQSLQDIRQATEAGQRVPTGIQWGEGGHKILVTGFDDGHVYYTNPWGKEERMSISEFEARLRNTHL